MAQLRCAQTSELLAEATPLEVATAAADFAPNEVVFDDVGPGFDPVAVREPRAEELAGLKTVLSELPARPPAGEDPARFSERRAGIEARIGERQTRIAAGKTLATKARKRQQAALARVEQRKALDKG
jgi:hypothetical protein